MSIINLLLILYLTVHLQVNLCEYYLFRTFTLIKLFLLNIFNRIHTLLFNIIFCNLRKVLMQHIILNKELTSSEV